MKLWLLIIIPLLLFGTGINGQETSDKDRLGMAIEYFQSGKYHEALMLFKQLNKKYDLNPRFQAYMGVCYYKEWDYKHAVSTLKLVLPKLQSLSPSELSVYNYCLAESLFALEEWDKASLYYETDLTLCHPNERGDIFTRLGYCALFKKKWEDAKDYFTSALEYYDKFGYTEANKNRKVQLSNMIRGCEENAQKEKNGK